MVISDETKTKKIPLHLGGIFYGGEEFMARERDNPELKTIICVWKLTEGIMINNIQHTP